MSNTKPTLFFRSNCGLLVSIQYPQLYLIPFTHNLSKKGFYQNWIGHVMRPEELIIRSLPKPEKIPPYKNKKAPILNTVK